MKRDLENLLGKKIVKNTKPHLNFYFKVLSFSSLPSSYPIPGSEWRAIYKMKQYII